MTPSSSRSDACWSLDKRREQNGGRRYYAWWETSTVAPSSWPESRSGAKKPPEKRAQKCTHKETERGKFSTVLRTPGSSLAKFSKEARGGGGLTVEAVTVCGLWSGNTRTNCYTSVHTNNCFCFRQFAVDIAKKLTNQPSSDSIRNYLLHRVAHSWKCAPVKSRPKPPHTVYSGRSWPRSACVYWGWRGRASRCKHMLVLRVINMSDAIFVPKIIFSHRWCCLGNAFIL